MCGGLAKLLDALLRRAELHLELGYLRCRRAARRYLGRGAPAGAARLRLVDLCLPRDAGAQQRQHLGLLRDAGGCVAAVDGRQAGLVQDAPPIRRLLHLAELVRRSLRLGSLALRRLERRAQRLLGGGHRVGLALLGPHLLAQQLLLESDELLLRRSLGLVVRPRAHLARQLVGERAHDLHLQLQLLGLALALPLRPHGGGEPAGERLVALEREAQPLRLVLVDGQLGLQLAQHQLELRLGLGCPLPLRAQRGLRLVVACVHLRAAEALGGGGRVGRLHRRGGRGGRGRVAEPLPLRRGRGIRVAARAERADLRAQPQPLLGRGAQRLPPARLRVAERRARGLAQPCSLAELCELGGSDRAGCFRRCHGSNSAVEQARVGVTRAVSGAAVAPGACARARRGGLLPSPDRAGTIGSIGKAMI